MSNSRRQLIKKIAQLDIQLHNQQANVYKHKKYLIHVIYDHRIILAATLLPAFLWGWRKGREKGVGKFLTQLIKMSLMTAISQAKQHLIRQFPLVSVKR